MLKFSCNTIYTNVDADLHCLKLAIYYALKHTNIRVIILTFADRYDRRYPCLGLRGGYSCLVQSGEHKLRGGAGGRRRDCGGNGDVKVARRPSG